MADVAREKRPADADAQGAPDAKAPRKDPTSVDAEAMRSIAEWRELIREFLILLYRKHAKQDGMRFRVRFQSAAHGISILDADTNKSIRVSKYTNTWFKDCLFLYCQATQQSPSAAIVRALRRFDGTDIRVPECELLFPREDLTGLPLEPRHTALRGVLVLWKPDAEAAHRASLFDMWMPSRTVLKAPENVAARSLSVSAQKVDLAKEKHEFLAQLLETECPEDRLEEITGTNAHLRWLCAYLTEHLGFLEREVVELGGMPTRGGLEIAELTLCHLWHPPKRPPIAILKKLRDKIRRLEQEVRAKGKLRAEVDSLALQLVQNEPPKISALRSKVRSLEEQLESHAGMVATLEARAQSLTHQLAASNPPAATVQGLEDEVGALLIKLDKRVREVNILRKQVEELDLQHEKLREMVASRDSTIKALERRVADREFQVQALDQQVAAHNAKVQALEQQLAARDAKVQALEQQLAARNAKAQAPEREAAERDAKVQALEQQVAARDAKVQALEQQVARVLTQARVGQRNFSVMSSRVHCITRELAASRAENEKLKQQLAKVKPTDAPRGHEDNFSAAVDLWRKRACELVRLRRKEGKIELPEWTCTPDEVEMRRKEAHRVLNAITTDKELPEWCNYVD